MGSDTTVEAQDDAAQRRHRGSTRITASKWPDCSFLENAALCDLRCEACEDLVGDDSRLQAMVAQR